MALSPAPPHPHTPLPPPPALAGSPLGKQLLKGNKEALKCSPPQLRFSQMSSCLHPQGLVPWGVDRPSLQWGAGLSRSLVATAGLGGTHCIGSRTYGSCCPHTGPPRQSTPSSGTPHISCHLPSLAFWKRTQK